MPERTPQSRGSQELGLVFANVEAEHARLSDGGSTLQQARAESKARVDLAKSLPALLAEAWSWYPAHMLKRRVDHARGKQLDITVVMDGKCKSWQGGCVDAQLQKIIEKTKP